MNDFLMFLGIANLVYLALTGYALMKILKRIEDRQGVQGTYIRTILHSVTARQSDLRTHKDGAGVRPQLDRPKAEQHYEGRGIKRVARGGKADPAGGESSTARIGQVKRRSYGGTSGTPESR